MRSTITALLLMFALGDSAQIIYTNVTPDSLISDNQSYNLDLNKDGIADFKITDSASGGTFTHCGTLHNYTIKITPLHSNAVLSDSVSHNQTAYHPYALQANDAIASSLSSWLAASDQTLIQIKYSCYLSRSDGLYHISAQSSGYWENTSHDKYAGLKLIKGKNIYYGWIRLSIFISPSSSSVTVKDYGLNSKPNEPILAGQKTSFNWIAVTALSAPPYCPGNSIQVNYIKSGNFNSSNIFTAQLSDATGSFLKPAIIGSKQSRASGTIKAVIPANTSAGTQYRIRVVSSDPTTDSVFKNKSDLLIGEGIITVSGPTTFCSGSYVYLEAPFGHTYQWLKNGKFIQDATAYILEVTASGSYRCIVHGACGTDTSNKIVVTVNPLPNATIFASGPTTFCKPGNVTLSDTVDKDCTYQWWGNYRGLIPGATKSSYVADSTDYYYIVATTKKGCSTNGSALANYILVDVPPVPSQASIELAGDTSFCIGDSLILGVTFNYNDPAPIYFQWKKNGNNIAGATNWVYFAKTAGTYTCRMYNLCGSVTTKGVTLTTKQCLTLGSNRTVNNEKIISTGVQLKVAPNPFSNTTSISYTLPQNFTTAQIVITDQNGKTVKAVKISGSGKGSLKLDASTLPSGVYQCSLLIDGKLINTMQMALSK